MPGVFISYSHDSDAHRDSVLDLANRLRDSGLHCSLDRDNEGKPVPEGWPRWMVNQVRQADYVLVVCTGVYCAAFEGRVPDRNRGVQWEAGVITDLLYENFARNKNVVAVGFGPHAQNAAHIPDILRRYNYFDVSSEHDLRLLCGLLNNRQDVQAVVPAAANAVPLPVPRLLRDQLEPVGGGMPPNSRFYVPRETHAQITEALLRKDGTLTVKGMRQMGKTSLLGRLRQFAEWQGCHVAITDFQGLSENQMADAKSLLLALFTELVQEFELDIYPQEQWNDNLGATQNLTRFLERYVLASKHGHCIWMLDEVDRMLGHPYCGEIFGVFRSWHNKRALRPGGPWSRLTLLIAHAHEDTAFIPDGNQSPFNVATRFTLPPFTVDEVAELNRRYGEPLQGAAEVKRLHEKANGGHPYHCRHLLNEMILRDCTLAQL